MISEFFENNKIFMKNLLVTVESYAGDVKIWRICGEELLQKCGACIKRYYFALTGYHRPDIHTGFTML